MVDPRRLFPRLRCDLRQPDVQFRTALFPIYERRPPQQQRTELSEEWRVAWQCCALAERYARRPLGHRVLHVRRQAALRLDLHPRRAALVRQQLYVGGPLRRLPWRSFVEPDTVEYRAAGELVELHSDVRLTSRRGHSGDSEAAWHQHLAEHGEGDISSRGHLRPALGFPRQPGL